ncbi:tetratricopeptide repeat protein [Micromonospora sp. NPDC048898]|uniref:tetratricopeptide repeat protein n=1 Tax=Micromonospora sp. NPDC048898 TaxID=3364260 RepID=UPI003717189C
MLEHTYGAVLLAALLQGSPVRGLGEDVTPVEIRFQQGARHPVDDLMVVGEHESGERRLHIGVRRNPSITSRNSEFIKLITDYLHMVVNHREDIDSDRIRLGLAVAGPHTACQEVAQLGQFARTHSSNKGFRAAVLAPRATNQKVRGRLRMLDEAVSNAASIAGVVLKSSHAADRLTWQLLRALRTIDLRLEGDDPADQDAAIAGLLSVAGGTSQAAALWRKLVSLSSRYAQTAGTVDRNLLVRDLSSQLNLLGASSKKQPRQKAREQRKTPANGVVESRHPHFGQLIAVNDCLAEHVGVHAASSDSDEETRLHLPPYILRDHDRELRSKLRSLSSEGGLLVVVGASSTGKSRSMYEAVREVFADWRLLLTDGVDAIRKAAKNGIPGKTLIWLDDTPTIRYLGPGGLTKTEIVGLIHQADGPVVVVDMLWPAAYQQLSTIPQMGLEAQGSDIWRDAREVLSLAGQAVIDVPDRFSTHEREQASRVANATGDRRLVGALADSQYGLTQHLAGAPQLITHWNHGKVSQPYGWAILTAAIDIRRIGIRAPLTAQMLSATAQAYLSGVQIAEASSDWLQTALAHSTKKLHGAVQALIPIPGPNMGTIAGYEVADYLQQYASIHRYYEPLPPDFRKLLSAHTDTPDVLMQLALNAEQCGSPHSAIDLYRRVYALNPIARRRLPGLLAATGQEDRLRELIALGDVVHARRALSDLLAKQGRENDLRKLSESGDLDARWKLTLFLLSENRHSEVQELASDGGIGNLLIDDLLTRPRELVRISRERSAASALATEILSRGGKDGSSPVLDDKNDERRQQLSACESELRRLAGEGSIPARRLLAELLAEQGREVELRAMAAAGDLAAQEEFVALSIKRASEPAEASDTGDKPPRQKRADEP